MSTCCSCVGSPNVGRLTNLKPAVRMLRPAVVAMPIGQAERDQARASLPWRKWYNSKRWRRLRWAILLRDLFTCRKCGRLEADTSRLVADHRIPHRGDERLFWSEANLWCLCKPCHDKVKQAEEAAMRTRGL